MRVTLAVELVLKNCRALGYSPVIMSMSGQYPFPYNFIRKFKDANSTIKKRILDGECNWEGEKKFLDVDIFIIKKRILDGDIGERADLGLVFLERKVCP